MELKSLIVFLPIVFMFHDFEEIIFFKPWLGRNKAYLKKRFPKLAERMLPHFEKLSTSAFALAVAEEFIMLNLITFASVYWENYYVWFAAFMGFSIHIVGHIIQWIIYGRYIPSIVTSLIVLPYCLYTFAEFLKTGILNVHEFVIWTFIGIILVVLNLLFAHKLALKFENWLGAAKS